MATASSPRVLGKHVQGMEAFRASSQDGQYMPFDPEGDETPTLKLGSQSVVGQQAPEQSYGTMMPPPRTPCRKATAAPLLEPDVSAAACVPGHKEKGNGATKQSRAVKRALDLGDSPRSVVRLHFMQLPAVAYSMGPQCKFWLWYFGT